ncbi:MAG: glycine zipper family protein [Gammaproteobacteria bacterium]
MQRSKTRFVFGAAMVMACVGCAQVPVAPTIAVMPAPGMPFEVFEQDNNLCRQYAQQQLGANPQQVANSQVAGGAVAGTVIGAAAGALLGGNSNAAGAGAATGLLFGAAAGAGAAGQTNMTLQQRYNIAFAQCMYAKGNQVPGYAYASRSYMPPPPPSEASPNEPPPPGTPPPPPGLGNPPGP